MPAGCDCTRDDYDDGYDAPDEWAPDVRHEPEADITTDDDPHVPMGSLLFANLPNRPMRMVSFEQEVGSGGNYLAEMLHEIGLSAEDYMRGYHSSREDSDGGFVSVEEDSSVAAELVWSKMELFLPTEAEKLAQGLETVRKAMREDRVKLDMRCGGHLHVDVPDYGVADTGSMYHLWAYLEDTVYRLGAANWPRHRTEVAHHNYAPPIPKGATNTSQALYALQRDDRSALNFGNLLQARTTCRCGAGNFGLWEECTCDMSRRVCTLEFRVFNTTANPIKLRAYIALCVGMVQYAKDNTITPARYPVFEWNGSSDVVDVDRSVERLRFILDKLPLEAADRQAIMYCVERSSLAPCIEKLQEGV